MQKKSTVQGKSQQTTGTYHLLMKQILSCLAFWATKRVCSFRGGCWIFFRNSRTLTSDPVAPGPATAEAFRPIHALAGEHGADQLLGFLRMQNLQPPEG